MLKNDIMTNVIILYV